MQNTLPSLIKAQEFDKRIIVLRRRLESLPIEVSEHESALLAMQAELDEADVERKGCLTKSVSIETEVGVREERIAKLDRTATESTDVSICKVAQHEATALREKISVDQEQALLLLERADELEAKLEKMRPERDEAASDLDSFRKTVAADSNDFKTELDGLLLQRHDTLLGSNAAVVKAFEALSERYAGAAVSSLRSDSCGGCGTRLVPNDCIRIQSLKAPVRCPSCTRFLVSADFWSAHSS
ncbi:MAG: putative nucleic acid-binding Zn-ribbon protein [Myxococcota bacterium]